MLSIPCPWCGERDEIEFGYGGQAHVRWPDDPASLDDAEWGAFLFVRANPRGAFSERWVHTAGCRRWFTAVRDTATNEIGSASPGRPVPEPGQQMLRQHRRVS